MNAPAGFDPVTLNHWLWYKYQCHEGTSTEFQRLFENIIKRAKPEFVQIRPYGSIGDRKCDGLFWVEDCCTVFQVYAPDELKQSEVQQKIGEDLAGAVQHWVSLKQWTFVYNARRGLGPDIPRTLQAKQQDYPNIRLDHLSSDALWELARSLSLQQRCEILGAPNGYEHLFLLPGRSRDEVAQHLNDGYVVLVQDMLSPISLLAVTEALAPSKPFGAPVHVRPTYAELPWLDAAIQQRLMLHQALRNSRDLLPRFAVFSLAPIPLVIHLGFVLSDRVEARCFQFDRNSSTWKWPEESEAANTNITVSGLPTVTRSEPIEVAISISLSARVHEEDVREAAPNAWTHIRVDVEQPDLMWLRSPRQLLAFAQSMRATFGTLRATIPRCSRIHLFYAGPTGGGVVLGQQINPRMNPPVELYQYSRQTKPAYQHALTLTENLS